jgi:putative nucleotidyltransferase with HDIG domain
LLGWDLRPWAERVAAARLSDQPRRLGHARAVARRAESAVGAVGCDADLLVAAALLHDIGYAAELADTGFHPLDGARHLSDLGAPARLTNLVARHSCAIVEARLRGLGAEVGLFPDECGPVRDALWYSDMTTSPDWEAEVTRKRARRMSVSGWVPEVGIEEEAA